MAPKSMLMRIRNDFGSKGLTIGFTAVEKFGPGHSGWSNFLKFSKLSQAEEIVGLDSILCARPTKELIDRDWDHLIDPEFPGIFDSLEYLSERVRLTDEYNILAVSRDPSRDEIAQFVDKRFEFLGFDLIESPPASTGISALTNCSGFDEAFQNGELSRFGLITDYDRAFEIREILKEKYPQEAHANCSVWAIWRLGASPNTGRSAAGLDTPRPLNRVPSP
jgi:hypothetical protein